MPLIGQPAIPLQLSSYHNPQTKQLRRKGTNIQNNQTAVVYNSTTKYERFKTIQMFLSNHKLI